MKFNVYIFLINQVNNNPILKQFLLETDLLSIFLPLQTVRILDENGLPTFPEKCCSHVTSECKWHKATSWNYHKTPLITQDGCRLLATEQFTCKHKHQVKITIK